MDVRAAIRRTRLPFVASLFFAMLLGAPAAIAAPVADPVPVSVAAAEKSSSATASTDEAAPIEQAIAVESPQPDAVEQPLATALIDQAVRAARSPRAPPAW